MKTKKKLKKNTKNYHQIKTQARNLNEPLLTVERVREQIAKEEKWTQDIVDAAYRPRELSDRERDFAVNYALRKRGLQYWAKLYGVSKGMIVDMMAMPGVQSIIREITSNIYKRMAVYEAALKCYAEEVYIHIMKMEWTEETSILKRQAAFDVLKLRLESDRLKLGISDDDDYSRPIKNVTPIQIENNGSGVSKSDVKAMSQEKVDSILQLASDIQIVRTQERLRNGK